MIRCRETETTPCGEEKLKREGYIASIALTGDYLINEEFSVLLIRSHPALLLPKAIELTAKAIPLIEDFFEKEAIARGIAKNSEAATLFCKTSGTWYPMNPPPTWQSPLVGHPK